MWPNLIHFGRFHIATYGVCVAAAYLVGIYWLKSQRIHMGLDAGRFWALIYTLFFGAIMGGKLLYVIVDWSSFASGQLHFFRDFRYGFVFYGGFLGAMGMYVVYYLFTKVPFLQTADYFGVALPIGHWLGRLGCFAAGCCYGQPTQVPWAVRFIDPASLVPESLAGIPLHPTQLYESAGDVVIAVLLYRVLRRTQRGGIQAGTAFYGYILLYALMRFVIEMFRGDDRGGFWLAMSPSQWIALGSMALVSLLMWHNGIWKTKSA